jgi:diguanylate cyclase (GGDEF)-like protein
MAVDSVHLITGRTDVDSLRQQSIEQQIADYLETGRKILNFSCGALIQSRGRYAVVRAVVSDRPAASPGVKFDLSQVCCGIVLARRATMASGSTAQDEFAGRWHYDTARHSSYIGTPVYVEGEVFGVLSFSSPEPQVGFGEREKEIIELMAKSIGRSIQEERLREARRRDESLEQDRGRILEMVARDEPLAAVLAEIAQLVERQWPAGACAIYTINQDRLHCVAAAGMPQTYTSRSRGIPVVVAENCALLSAASGVPHIFQTAAPQCQPNKGPPSIHEFCWQAGGSSPILSGSGQILGVIAAYWKLALEPRYLDAHLLETASHLASVAMERHRLTGHLAFQARHDALTGLPNRALFSERLQEAVARAFKIRTPLAVVFSDIDRFKRINDHFGHGAGDTVLRTFAERIRSCLLPGEIAGRIGGDEFVALLCHFDGENSARRRAHQMLALLREPVPCSGKSLYVTASVGVSTFPQGGQSAESLLASADQAMYWVKNSGRNDVGSFRPDIQKGHLTRLELEYSLRQALEAGEFQLYFQPILDIRDEIALDSIEVLLGWNHPTLGRIGPAQFIPVAEDCGMIAAIGSWVLREACRKCADWQSAGVVVSPVSVNVSAVQFARPDFVATVEAALVAAGLDGSWLQLELTESAVMENIASAMPKLERLKTLGVRLSMDDFGAGYSSLSYLRWIPVDSLKMDRAFVVEIAGSANGLTLVNTIVEMAHNMGLPVVAEGVETRAQLELLRSVGCDRAQGHWFSGPLPEQEFLSLPWNNGSRGSPVAEVQKDPFLTRAAL